MGRRGAWGFNLNQYPSFTEVVVGEPGVTSSTTLPLNQWTHVAVSRSGSNLRIFMNGVKTGEATNTTNFSSSSYNLLIGRSAPSESVYYNGYIDELRITKGVARYTTSFTPSTQPHPDRNSIAAIGPQQDTLYFRSSKRFAWYKGGLYSSSSYDPGPGGSVSMVLNENGNLLIGTTTDNSQGLLQVNGTISASSLNISGASSVNASQLGGVSSASFVRTDYNSIIQDPYTLSFGSGAREVLYLSKQSYPDPYFSYVKVLLHCDGTNNSTTILDSSLNARTVTPYYNSKLSTTQQKFGVSSLYQDGTDDYVSFNSSDIDVGANNFTIEFWIYPTASSTVRRYIGYENGSPVQGIVIRDNNGSLHAYVVVDSTYYHIYTSTAPTLNTWQHIALVRVGNVFTLYKDGVSIGSITQAITIKPSTNSLWYIGFPGTEYFVGYMDEIRVTQGIARYTAAFTPSTIPFPDYVSTDDYDPYYGYVLALFHGIGSEGGTNIYDSSPSPLTITNTGVTTRTAQFKFSTSSLYFTGSSYFTFPVTNYLNDLSTAFTIEFWMYATSADINTNTWPIIYSAESSASRRYSVYMHGTTGQTVYFISFTNYVGNEYVASTTTLNINQWYHVAFVCTGSKTVKVYVNGTFHNTTTFTTTLNNGESLNHTIGDAYNFDDRFTGYLQDFRITKSIARYTSDFTPLQKLFPDKASQFLDPYFDKVNLLLHFNGANSSTSFIDSSLLALTVTPSGDAKISTTQSKFGVSSAYFDGTGDYLTVPKTSYFDFGSGDFSIEMWCYLIDYNTSGYPRGLWSTGKESGPDYYSTRIHVSDTKKLLAVVSTNGTSASYITDADDFTLNTWHHIALVRYGNTVTLYKDGVSVGTPQTILGSIYYSTAYPVCISNLPDYGGMAYNNKWYGYIDEIRITKGIARYTANFIIPQAAFADAPVVHSLGTQIGSMYSRSTSGRFDWYRGGTYSNIAGDAGANGYRGMNLTIDSSGNSSLAIGSGSGDTGVEVGTGRTSNGYGYIDFVTDTTYTDYGLRLIRNNSGANTTSFLYHRGTGALSITTVEAGDLILQTTSTDRLRVLSGGRILIGAGADDGTNLLQVEGSIVQSPLASVTPANNGELVFEATSDTTITVKYKGSDGTVRTGTITLT